MRGGRGEYVGGTPRLRLLLRIVLLQERVGGAVARAQAAARSARVERHRQAGRCARYSRARGFARCRLPRRHLSGREVPWRHLSGCEISRRQISRRQVSRRGLAWCARGITRGGARGIPWRGSRGGGALRLPQDRRHRTAMFDGIRRAMAARAATGGTGR